MARMGKCFTLGLLVVLVVSSLSLIESTQAQFDIVTTYCSISVDSAVEGQPIIVTIQMSPPTPTGEGYRVFIWVTPPNPKDFSANEPWVKNILTDSNGRATVTFNVPAYSGTWYVDVSFGSNNFANHTILYEGGNWRTQFTVSPAKTATPTNTATPTSSPTINPTIPEFPMAASLTAVLVGVGLLLLISKRRSASKLFT